MTAQQPLFDVSALPAGLGGGPKSLRNEAVRWRRSGLLSLMEGLDEPVTAAALAELAGYDRRQVFSDLVALLERGFVTLDGVGDRGACMWRLTDHTNPSVPWRRTHESMRAQLVLAVWAIAAGWLILAGAVLARAVGCR